MSVIARKASLIDVSDIVAFGKSAHPDSNWGTIPFNAACFRQSVMRSLKDVDSCVFIARRDGDVCGLLIGCTTPLLFSPLYCATDQVFVARSGGDRLLRLFLDWCKTKRVVRVDMGNSQADRRGMDRLMSRYGMSRAGGMYFRNGVIA